MWRTLLVVLANAERLVHWSVAEMERNFELCVRNITVGKEAQSVVWRPEESAETAARRVAARDVAQVAAFLEHQASIALMIRMDFRYAARELIRDGVGLFVAAQGCKESVLDRVGRWLVVDGNTFNAGRRSDWDFFFGDKVSSVVLGCDAFRSMGHSTFPNFVDLAFEWLLPGGTLDVHADRPVTEVLFRTGFAPGAGRFADDAPATATCGAGTTRVHKPEQPESTLGVLVINLQRRPDRWSRVVAAAGRAGLPPVERIDAVDGKELDPSTPDVARIFNLSTWRYGSARNAHQDHGYRRRVLGCALSHLEAWKRVAERDEIHLVLEDDVTFGENFVARWVPLLESLRRDRTWDLVQLGVLDDRDLYGDAVVLPGLKRFSSRPRTFGAGAFAYLLRPRTARFLLDYARQWGIQQAVDWWLVDRYVDLVAYKADPHLAFSPQGEGRDSDNDELYDQARLLLDSANDAHQYAAFVVDDPAQGAVVVAGEQLEIRGHFLVDGRPDLFLHRHALARLCVSARFLDDSNDDAREACIGLGKGNATLTVPGSWLMRPGWYAFDVALRALDADLIAASSVLVEAVRDSSKQRQDPHDLAEAAFSTGATHALDVAVDDKTVAVTCADVGRAKLYACVRDFCLAHSIQPRLDCLASLLATFAAHFRASAALLSK